MTSTVLSRRAINRATLARQLLLRRSPLAVPDAVEHLVGLQAQTPHTWYVGLWSRLAGFTPDHAATLLTGRQLVRIGLMRSTIHLVTARDCLALRPIFDAPMSRAMAGNFGKNLVGIDPEELREAGRFLVEERPLTFSELGRRLGERWPDRDEASLAQAIRAWVPLVQVPPRGVWGASGPAAHTSAESWLGGPLASKVDIEALVLRYLGAFGPASVRDLQTWSGLTRLAEVVDRLRPSLVTFADEQGRELFDLPEAPRPEPDTPAPVRLLYDFDNLLLSHADRSRIITDSYHRQGFTITGPIPSLVLIDGFTAASWKLARSRGVATVTIQPFGKMSKKDAAAVTKEARGLLAFAAAGVSNVDVEILSPP